MPDQPTTTTPYSRIWRPHDRYVRAEARPMHTSGVLSDRFDRGVAFTGYGLLAFSVVSFGLAAVAALALGRAHARGAHPITLTHYRFQARIFSIGAAALVLGALTAFVATAFAISEVWTWLAARWSGLDRTVGAWAFSERRAGAAGWLILGAVLLGVSAVGHTLIASAWGAMKLVRGQSIGHIDHD